MNHKLMFSILLIAISTICVFGQVSDNIKTPKHIRVSEAYGFLVGQEYTLTLIKKEFPQLEINVLKAQMLFGQTFGKSKEGIVSYLTDYIGQNDYNVYTEKIKSDIQKLLQSQTITLEIAINFIAEVENRAKGNIVSPVLETLLSFQFSELPPEELILGFTNVFKTKGHLKSKGTDWQIKVPKSWKAEEADRPNIIQKFTSDYGAGNQAIMLTIKEMPLPKGYKITKEELNELFSEKEMKDIVPEGGIFVSFTKMTLDKNIGGMIEFEQTVERLDLKFKMRMVQFMFIRGNKMYMLQCSVGSEKTDADLSLEMKKYLPLYKLVANTIVVNEQYK